MQPPTLRRLAAAALLGLGGGLVVAFVVARGSAGGADALAYWGGTRTWLAGLDPYHPPGLFLAWVYAPWLLPAIVPWALLPWPVAWFAWRAAMALLLGWSVTWAYRRRPLATALVFVALAGPLAATFDTGNVTLFLALAVWAAQWTGPRLGGALWALASAVKWFPAILWVFLPPRARLWGLAAAAVVLLLTLATWPFLLTQLELAMTLAPSAFPRPLRIDHLVLLWAAVPWLWRRSWPGAGLDLAGLPACATAAVQASDRRLADRLRAFLGLG
ncbi:MAG: hypothetical protein A2X23_04825 [Chloroflexi bacterium GWC2_73_18]|nr:MAG: hypothetical protein A2X23_04825 [Chloroflexi bacterium GWC2_73_18]